MPETPIQLFQAGRLQEAIAALNEEVRGSPTDIGRRSQLVEFLCVGGDLERAERQLVTITQQDPSTLIQASTLRHLLRADMARRQVWAEGRAPEFLTPPPEHVTLRLEALVYLRDGRLDEVAACLEKAEALRPVLSGRHEDVPFSDFRDLDDLTAGVLEVLTTTGKYYWVPLEHVDEIAFSAPARALDTVWRHAELSVRGGTTGQIVIPAIYPTPSIDHRDAALLGRETDWVEAPAGCVRGIGQRCYLVGEENLPVMQLTSLAFDPA